MSLSPKLLDGIERAVNTLIQALGGSATAGLESVLSGQADWKTALVGVGTTGVLSALMSVARSYESRAKQALSDVERDVKSDAKQLVADVKHDVSTSTIPIAAPTTGAPSVARATPIPPPPPVV